MEHEGDLEVNRPPGPGKQRRSLMRSYGGSRAAFIALLILSLMLCAVFVLGQGGTGREATNTNSRTKPPAPKPTRSPPKAGTPRRSTAPANNNRRQPTDKPKVDAAAANERTYWETIRLSSDPEDFKAYLKKYPDGQFTGLARDNLRRLETAAKPRLKTDAAGRIILGAIGGSNPGAARPAPKPGSVVRNQLGMALVYVPAGSFMMGSNNGGPDEEPVHEVTIKEGFYIGRYEVTQAEWQQLMGNNPSTFKGDSLPAEQVSWDDAQIFINKLNERGDGFKYRLPTEAEWEYACRAGTTGDYAGEVNEMGWFSENSGSKTHTVGTKRPNGWGLADMHGNVWEWCADYYHETYNGAPTDGSTWLTGTEMKYRVLRGGSWDGHVSDLRSAGRLRRSPAGRAYDFGFRVAAVVRTQ